MSDKGGVICLAVYKPDRTLLRWQIDSLKKQSLSDWTCLIGIDGGDAATQEVVNTIVFGDPRFQVHPFEKRLGFYRNFERLLTLVPHDALWVALSDQDDRWYPEKLEKLVTHLQQVSLVSGQANLIEVNTQTGRENDLGRTTSRRSRDLSGLIFDNAVSGALSVFRTDLLNVALPFPQPTDVAYHDHWLGICASLLDGIRFVEEPMQDYVQHEQNVIGENRQRPLQRFRRLLDRAKNQNPIVYLVIHRWGWRVNMSRSAMRQCRHLSPKNKQILEAFAKDKFSIGLLRLAFENLRDSKQSRLRILALMCASVFAPLVDSRRNDD